MALAEAGAMDEAEVRIVKRVFHQTQAGGLPDFVELRNAPKTGRAVFFKLGNAGQWHIGKADPDIAIAVFSVKALRLGAGAA